MQIFYVDATVCHLHHNVSFVDEFKFFHAF